MYTKCTSSNMIAGKTKPTSEPKKIAKPKKKTIPPRYIGFRLCWKAPSVTRPPRPRFRVIVAWIFMNKPTIAGPRPIKLYGYSNIIRIGKTKWRMIHNTMRGESWKRGGIDRLGFAFTGGSFPMLARDPFSYTRPIQNWPKQYTNDNRCKGESGDATQGLSLESGA